MKEISQSKDSNHPALTPGANVGGANPPADLGLIPSCRPSGYGLGIPATLPVTPETAPLSNRH